MPTAQACSDSQKNWEETDIDCGGPVCTGCGMGQVLVRLVHSHLRLRILILFDLVVVSLLL